MDTDEIIAQAKAEAEHDPAQERLEQLQAQTEDQEAQDNIPEEDRKVVAELARNLIAKNVNVRKCVGTMIAARQLYGVCVEALTRTLAKLPTEEGHELLEECLIQAAGHQAAQEFNENDLFVGLQDTAMPWLMETVKAHNQEDERNRKLDLELWEEARRKQPVPVGVKFDHELIDMLPRDRDLVLVGWSPAVAYILDKIVTAVLAARTREQLFCVIRLQTFNTQMGAHKRFLRLGGKDWKDCCKTAKSWPRHFQRKLLDRLSDPLDLLVVVDYAHSSEALLWKQRSASRAANSKKKFAEWCRKMGSGLVGGVPLVTKEPPDLATAEWEMLRLFSILRPVWVDEKDKHYVLRIGKDVYREEVPREALDMYGGGTIIQE